jgi:hypothetical protein
MIIVAIVLIFVLYLTVILLFHVLVLIVAVIVNIVFTLFLSANAGCTCDIAVADSAVNIPAESTTSINTFFVFKFCYRKLLLNNV